MSNDSYLDANRANWDDRVPGHLAPSEYRVDELVSNPAYVSKEAVFAAREIGGVSGMTLAHLQCHIGTDTISIARLGAMATGLDFSPRSIEAATALARDCGVDARFVLGDVHDAPALLGEQFDVVYTGVGSLCWLPDVRRWAAAAAASVRPGGILYLHEVHPTVQSLGDDWGLDGPRLEYPYFETIEPDALDSEASYTGEARLTHTRTYQWNHGLGETVTALIDAGLRIRFLHEHTQLCYQAWPHMVRDAQGWWTLPEGAERLPMMFSLLAEKEGG